MSRRKLKQPAIEVVIPAGLQPPRTVEQVDEWIADEDRNLEETMQRHTRMTHKLRRLRAVIASRAQEAN